MSDSKIMGRRLGPEPASEADHFTVCTACGQAYDKQIFSQVMHHQKPGHKPLERQ